jgi:hypothetical protein
MKHLATETITSRNISKERIAKIIYTDFNDNTPLNRMLIKATKRIGALKEEQSYTLDIDATFIPTECRGALRKFKNDGKIEKAKIGFSPMVCLIGELPVFISMRNGDAGARFKLPECLGNCLALLDESKIKVGRVISDAAGYNKELFEMLNARNIKFNVRFPYTIKMERFKEQLHKCNNWRKTEIETANYNWKCEIADISYKMHDIPAEKRTSPTWRVVAIRIPTQETLQKIDVEEYNLKIAIQEKMVSLSKKKVLKERGKPYLDTNWKQIDGYEYKFFITNDFKRTSEEIVFEYNNRGTAERQFSFMKNDFGWKFPPFMNMNENTVFLIAASLANNIFRGTLKIFREHIPQLRLNSRLREFQFLFIDVACELVNGDYEFFNTDIDYEKIM